MNSTNERFKVGLLLIIAVSVSAIRLLIEKLNPWKSREDRGIPGGTVYPDADYVYCIRGNEYPVSEADLDELDRIESDVVRKYERSISNIKDELADLEDRDDKGADNREQMLSERLGELQQVDLPTLFEKHQERYLRRREKGFSRRYEIDFEI